MMAFILPALLFGTLVVHGVLLHRPTKENLLLTPWFVIACILCIPQWTSSLVGHESVYLDLYHGAPWVEGNTLSYPSMQLWWKLWGKALSHSDWGIQAISLLSASLCVQLFALILFRTTQSKEWSVLGGFALLLHPDFSSWMGHIYNIIPPLLFSLYAQLLVQKNTSKDITIGSISLSLAILMRLEFFLVVPFFLLQVSGKKQRLALIIGALLCGLGLYPILNEIPGEGERLLSFFINLPMAEYWTPNLWILISLLCVTTHKKSLATGIYILGLHLVFCTFNDYGTRHVLFAMPIIIWILCARRAIIAMSILFLGIIWGRIERQEIYEASQEDFAQHIESHFPNLPRLTVQQAKADGCAWIVEEEPFIGTPVRSHFNLYNPKEEAKIRNEYGCIHWCSTLEEWRWSALGVRERAIRLHSLYVTKPIHIIVEKDSQCILYDIRSRTR